MTPDEFRRLGHQLIDWIADYRSKVATLPVRSAAVPGAVRARLPATPPEQPESLDALFRDLDEVIIPGLSHWQHPSFFAYFPSNGELSSVLGDYLSTGLGVLGLSWQSSPALSELEETVCDWLRQMMGLSEAWSGVIQDTASTSTLVALLCARERASGYALGREGLQSSGKPLTVYLSRHAHSSVQKAALLTGIGQAHIRFIDTDAHHAMIPAALEESLAADDGKTTPCAIVATSGTTTTTAFDPIRAIGEIAARRQIWLHLDAAMAGSAMILPECRQLWDGVELADSLVVNPHKWLGAAFDCSTYYVRDAQHLVRVMSTNPSYLQTAADAKVKNLRDWGIPLGRRFRALKLWCLIREQGVSGLQARLRRDLENAQWLAGEIAKTPHWRVLAPVQLQTVCVRHEPPSLDGASLDQHTQAWAEAVNASGKAYVTPAILDGRWMVRVSIGALATERQHVEALWDLLQEAAA